jgi:hypothetical protein
MDHERPRLVSIPGTREQIPVARSSLYKIIDTGELKRVRVGGRVFVTQASIDSYIQRLSAEAVQK